MVKKVVQQGRSDFDARSVLLVREHDKMARTPLVAFFNISHGRPMKEPSTCPYQCIKKLEEFEGEPKEIFISSPVQVNGPYSLASLTW